MERGNFANSGGSWGRRGPSRDRFWTCFAAFNIGNNPPGRDKVGTKEERGGWGRMGPNCGELQNTKIWGHLKQGAREHGHGIPQS